MYIYIYIYIYNIYICKRKCIKILKYMCMKGENTSRDVAFFFVMIYRYFSKALEVYLFDN